MFFYRITPTYAFVIFFSVTFLNRLGDGPIWKTFAEREESFCRQNWWINLIYLNNYFSYDTPCIQFGWFLAVDFQLIILSSIILAIIYKYPQRIAYILGGTYIIWIYIFSITFYTKNLAMGVSFWPELQKHAIVDDKTYSQLHIRTEMLFESTIMGFASSYIYFKLKKANINPNDYKFFSFIYISFIPVLISLLASVTYYDYNENATPLIIQTLHGTLFKIIFSIYVGALLVGFGFDIGGTKSKENKFYSFNAIPRRLQSILGHSAFLILGRLTFCTFLVHPSFMRLLYAQIRTPVHINFINMYVFALALVVLSYKVSIILVLFVEMPLTSLINILIIKFQNFHKSTKNVKNE